MPQTLLPGLSKLITTLEDIKLKCGGEENDPTTAKKEKRDDFVILKQQLYGLLHILRENIRERVRILKKSGNNYQAIEKGARIRDMIAEVEKYLPKLQQLQMKKSRTGKVGEEEKRMRVEDIRIIVRQLEEAKLALAQNVEVEEDTEEMRNILLGEQGGSDDENGELKGVRAMLGDDYIVENDRDMNAAEKDAVERWKKRDGDFDDLLDQIGLVVDRLNPMALQMGETAQKQSVIAQELTHKSEKAEDDLTGMSKKITTILATEKNSDFICKLILFMFLLTILGVCAQQMRKKLD